MIRKIVLSAALVAATSLAGVEPAHAIVEGIGDSPRVSDLDRNLVANVALRAPTPTQNHAAQNFLADYPHAQIRFDNGSGSIDTLFNFASPPYAGSAEDAALAFVADHADLLGGLQAANLEIDSRLTRAVLGGHLLRFNQVVNGIVVDQAGLGIVVDGDNRVRALFGPVYPNVNTNLNPSLASEAAVALAIADLATSARNLNAQALNLLQPGFDAIEAQLGNAGLTIADIARQEGLSQRYLQRLFERQSTTFSAYVRERRLERCCNDLIDPNYADQRIAEISYRWGFTDQAHFSRMFSATYGTSPRDFRKAVPRDVASERTRGRPRLAACPRL